MINPLPDGLVWATVAVFLVLIGARAWVVETGEGRLGRAPAKVRALTGATVGVLVVLVALLAVQGGALLVRSLLTGTEPLPAAPAAGQAVPGEPVPAAPAPVDPAAPVPPG